MFKTRSNRQYCSIPQTGLVIPSIPVYPIGRIKVYRPDQGILVQKRVWATRIPNRLIIALTSDNNLPSQPLNSLQWEMITIQPEVDYQNIYDLNFGSLPTSEVENLNWGQSVITRLNEVENYISYQVDNSNIRLWREKEYSENSDNYLNLVQGVGITFQRAG